MAHELAKKLLEMPDLPVVSVGDYGLYPVDEAWEIVDGVSPSIQLQSSLQVSSPSDKRFR